MTRPGANIERMTRSERIRAYGEESESRIAHLPASTLKDGTHKQRAEAINREVEIKYGLAGRTSLLKRRERDR